MFIRTATLAAYARSTLFGAFSLAAFSACSGSDATELDAGSGEPAAESSSRDREPAGDGLTIVSNTSERLTGTFAGAEQPISFELERSGERYTASIYGSDEAPLLRLTTSPERERMEFGGELTLDGPHGSLFNPRGPEWSRVSFEGDQRQLASLMGNPALSSFAELAAAVEGRTDIEPTLFPAAAAPFRGLDASAPAGSELGVARQALEPFSGSCVSCNLACSGATLACVLAQGGGWWAWITCAPANIACHAACVSNACN